MAKYTEENVKRAKANLGRFFGPQQEKWKREGIIPDIYLDPKGWEYVDEARAMVLRDILRIKALKYGTLADKDEIGVNTLMNFRKGDKRLYQWQYDSIVKEIGELTERIERFVAKPAQPTLSYFEEACQILEDRSLVKTTIYRAVEAYPRPTITWFYPTRRKAYGPRMQLQLEKYLPYLEGLRTYLETLRDRMKGLTTSER